MHYLDNQFLNQAEDTQNLIGKVWATSHLFLDITNNITEPQEKTNSPEIQCFLQIIQS